MRYNVTKLLLTINFQKSQIYSPDVSYSYFRDSSQRHFHSFKDNQHSWSVLEPLYSRKPKEAHKKFACLLLNLDTSLPIDSDKYHFLWSSANLKIAVDGSANYLSKKNLLQTADIVCGDFDSIDPKLLEKLRNPRRKPDPHAQCKPLVIETPDQNATDFTKAIRVSHASRPDINFFFAQYDHDGSRIDHLFGLINTIHLIKKPVVLVNIRSNTISWLLTAGNHMICKPKGKELCSLVPFNGPTEVKTRGLEYNLNPSIPLNFGDLVSTSNVCQSNCENIFIETSRNLLWSIDLDNALVNT